MSIKTLVLIPIFISFSVFAQSQSSALTFKAWKTQQLLEAQNQVLRLNSRIAQIKSGKASTESKTVEDLPSERFRKSTESEMTVTERDLHRAQENLAAVSSLKFEDYVNVYIPTLQDQPEVLNKLIEKLTKEELVEVVKSMVKKSPDARHKSEVLQELRGMPAQALR